MGLKESTRLYIPFRLLLKYGGNNKHGKGGKGSGWRRDEGELGKVSTICPGGSYKEVKQLKRSAY